MTVHNQSASHVIPLDHTLAYTGPVYRTISQTLAVANSTLMAGPRPLFANSSLVASGSAIAVAPRRYTIEHPVALIHTNSVVKNNEYYFSHALSINQSVSQTTRKYIIEQSLSNNLSFNQGPTTNNAIEDILEPIYVTQQVLTTPRFESHTHTIIVSQVVAFAKGPKLIPINQNLSFTQNVITLSQDVNQNLVLSHSIQIQQPHYQSIIDTLDFESTIDSDNITTHNVSLHQYISFSDFSKVPREYSLSQSITIGSSLAGNYQLNPIQLLYLVDSLDQYIAKHISHTLELEQEQPLGFIDEHGSSSSLQLQASVVAYIN